MTDLAAASPDYHGLWSNLTTGYLAGTGSNMTWLDPAKRNGNRQFYRLLIRQP